MISWRDAAIVIYVISSFYALYVVFKYTVLGDTLHPIKRITFYAIYYYGRIRNRLTGYRKR